MFSFFVVGLLSWKLICICVGELFSSVVVWLLFSLVIVILLVSIWVLVVVYLVIVVC